MKALLPISLPMLRRIALFSPLSDQQLERLRGLLHPKRCAAGDFLFQQDDPGDCMYIIASGRVRIFLIHDRSGREINIRVYGAGSAFGEFAVLDDQPRSTGAAAMDDLLLYTLHRDHVWALLHDNFDLTRHVIALLTERLRYTTRYAQNLVFLDTLERCALMILYLTEARGGGDQCEEILQINQEDLANLVGARREWLNKQLQPIVERGYIQLRRKQIVIMDRGALQGFLRERGVLDGPVDTDKNIRPV